MKRCLKGRLLLICLAVLAGIVLAVNVGATETDVAATVTYGVEGVDGWGSQSATFKAPEGWLLSFDNMGFSSELKRFTSYEGNYTYYLLKSGEETPIEKSVGLKLDVGKPIISNVAVSKVTDSAATVTVTATDALSGVYRYEMNGVSNADGLFALSGLSPNTSYKYMVTVYDKAGNSNATECTFTTEKTDISNSVVTVGGTYTYNGGAQTPTANAVTVVLNGKTLGTDQYDFEAADNIDAGTATVTVTGKGAFSGTAKGSFTIGKKALTVTAYDQTVTYGTGITTEVGKMDLKGTVSGTHKLSSVTLTASTDQVTANGYITPSAAVLYDTASGKDVTANYSISYGTGKLVIEKSTPRLVFGSGYSSNYTYDGNALSTPSADELTVSGTAYSSVKFLWYRSSVADGNKLSSAPRDAGTYVLVAVVEQSANNHYASAERIVTVSPRALTVTADAQSKNYGQSDPELTYTVTSGSLISGETLVGKLTRDASEDAGSYAIRQGTLTDSNNPNYRITFVGNDLTIFSTAPEITVTVDPSGQVAGQLVHVSVTVKNPYSSALTDLPSPTLTYTVGNGRAQTVALSNGNGSFIVPEGASVGTEIHVSAVTEGTGNYKRSTASATVTVIDKIRVDDAVRVQTSASFVYGEAPAVKGSFSGKTEGTVSWTYLYSNDGGASYRTLDALQNSDGYLPAGNYTVKALYMDDTQMGEAVSQFTVTPRKIVVTPDKNQSKGYGDADPVFTYTHTSLLGRDAFVGKLGREQDEAVGQYRFTLGTLAVNSNYDISLSNSSLTFTIDKKTLTSVSVGAITAPVAGATPQSTVTGGSNYSATLSWQETPKTFAYNTAYTVTVTLTPNSNYKFVASTEVIGFTFVSCTSSGTLTVKKTFPATEKDTIQRLTAPSDVKLTEHHTTVRSVASDLPQTVTIQTLAGVSKAYIVWSCDNYSTTPSAVNTFRWSLSEAELANYNVGSVKTSGTIRVTNSDTIPVSIRGNDTQVVSRIATYDVSDLFIFGAGAGSASYMIAGGTGEGSLLGDRLTVTEDGTFVIRVTTDANGVYGSGRAVATLTFELDDVSPVISGIRSNATYYTTQQAVVTDKNLARVSLGGSAVNTPVTLVGNTDATYTVVASDAATNITAMTVTMKPIASLVADIEGVTVDNVTSDDAAAIESIRRTLKNIDTIYATDAEKQELEEIENRLDALTERLRNADDARHTESIEAVENVTKDNVKPEDKDALETAMTELRQAQQTYGGNYTDGEARELQQDIDRINEALWALERVEALQTEIEALPDVSDSDAESSVTQEQVDQLREAYEALDDHAKSLIDTEKLDALEAILTDYGITEGADTKWKKGSEEALTFGCNGSVRKLVAIKVDDAVLAAGDYTLESGYRTRVTLAAEYLETLSKGKHTLTMVYEDGEASTTFEIKGASLWWLWLLLLLLLVAAAVVATWEIRKRQQRRA